MKPHHKIEDFATGTPIIYPTENTFGGDPNEAPSQNQRFCDGDPDYIPHRKYFRRGPRLYTPPKMLSVGLPLVSSALFRLRISEHQVYAFLFLLRMSKRFTLSLLDKSRGLRLVLLFPGRDRLGENAQFFARDLYDVAGGGDVFRHGIARALNIAETHFYSLGFAI